MLAVHRLLQKVFHPKQVSMTTLRHMSLKVVWGLTFGSLHYLTASTSCSTYLMQMFLTSLKPCRMWNVRLITMQSVGCLNHLSTWCRNLTSPSAQTVRSSVIQLSRTWLRVVSLPRNYSSTHRLRSLGQLMSWSLR